MRRRTSFQPSCSQIEALETRSLMNASAVAFAPVAGAVAPAPTAPLASGTPLSSVAPGLPTANTGTLPQDKLLYSIPTLGLGNKGAAGLLNVTTTITNPDNGAVIYQSTKAIPVDGSKMQTVQVSVDLSHLGSGLYGIKVSARDGSFQDSTVMTSKTTTIKVTAPVTKGNPFTVALYNGPVFLAGLL